MTNGSPMKLILQFCIPLFFGMLFQQFYSMMDTVIVGKFLGVNALAAVGATGSINFMIIGFCMGVCNGFAIPVAQQFGAGGLPCPAQICGKQRVAYVSVRRGDDCGSMRALPADSDVDEYAVRYYGRRVRIHIYYISGNSGHVSV